VRQLEIAVFPMHHAPKWIVSKLPDNPTQLVQVREQVGHDGIGQEPILLHVRLQFSPRGIVIMASTGGGGEVGGVY
jgi:hypothetical protein